jgi:hypothetical protein
LLYLPLELSALDYCTIENVKTVLDTISTDCDNELAECVNSANALVDALLRAKGLVVPLVVPQLVADACKFFAAWDFRRRRDPTGADAFWTEANRILEAYAEGEKEPYVGSV